MIPVDQKLETRQDIMRVPLPAEALKLAALKFAPFKIRPAEEPSSV